MEKLKENRSRSDIAAIIAKIDGIVSGVATTMSLERIQSTGDHCELLLYCRLLLLLSLSRGVCCGTVQQFVIG